MSRSKGSFWEKETERWLRRQNIRIIHKNYHCRAGEIDLIVRDGDQIAFIEIKYRSGQKFGSGADHVTPAKQRRIVATARSFLQYHRHAPSQVFRFDVISISNTAKEVQFRWIKSAFDAV